MTKSTNMRVAVSFEKKLKELKLMSGIPMSTITAQLADCLKNPKKFKFKLLDFK